MSHLRRWGKRFEISFALLLLVVFIGYNLISNGVLSRIAYNSASDSLLDSALFYTDRIVSQTVSNLDAAIYDYNLLMTSLSGNASLIRLITEEKDMTMEDRLLHEHNVMVFLEHIMNTKPDTACMLIVGTNGYLYTNDARLSLDTDYDFVGSQWFAQALQSQDNGLLGMQAINNDFYKKNTTYYNKCLPALTCLIHDYANQIIGCIFCFLDPQGMIQSLYMDNFSEFGGVFLVNRNQEIVMHRDISMLQSHIDGDLIEGMPDASREPKSFGASNDPLWAMAPSHYVNADAVCSISLAGIQGRLSKYQVPLFSRLTQYTLMSLLLGLFLALFLRRYIVRLTRDLSTAKREQAFHPQNYRIRELNRIALRFSDLLDSIASLDEKNYRLQLSSRLAQLNTLVSQMNPHFLFNSLQLIQTEIAYGKPERAETMLVSISRLLRYTIDKKVLLVTLEEELRFTSDFVSVFQARENGALHLSITCPEALKSEQIPKYLLQPLVENSIIHGFAHTRAGGDIAITCGSDDKLMHISIRDNGNGMTVEALEQARQSLERPAPDLPEPESVGLINIHQRIQLLYGKQYGLHIDSQEGAFTCITITIPKGGVQDETAYRGRSGEHSRLPQ